MESSWKILTDNQTHKCFDSGQEKTWSTPWYFVQGADPQYGFMDRKNPKPDLTEEIELTEKAVEKINQMNPKPRFFIICGDLCNTVQSSNAENFKLQEEQFKKIFGKINPNIPVLVACGNHDIGDKPTAEDFKLYENCWGDDYYSFWCGGIFFVVLNSQFYKGCEEEALAQKHNAWLEEQLKQTNSEAGKSRVVVFQHIPWFIDSAHEEDNYFSVDKDIRLSMLDKFVDAGVQKIFCGHCHRNTGGTYKDMELVVTSSMCGQLGSDQPGVRIVKVCEDKIDHVYYNIDDIPSTITF